MSWKSPSNQDQIRTRLQESVRFKLTAVALFFDDVHVCDLLSVWSDLLDAGLMAVCASRRTASSSGQIVSHSVFLACTSPIVLLHRTNPSPPLTSIPFDLLFINAFIPPTFEAIRAKQKGKRLLGTWWRAASAFYKLTPLLYGRKISSTRKPDSALSTLIWRILDIPFQMMFGAYDPSETQVRVPASDRTILLPIAERQGPNNGVFIRLDATGKPRTLDETLRLLKQDRAAREGGRDPIADYQVVWVPRFWRTRVYVMILSALASCSAVLAVGFFGTLVVGRLCTAWAFGNGVGDGRVHDGYSLVSRLVHLHLYFWNPYSQSIAESIQLQVSPRPNVPSFLRYVHEEHFHAENETFIKGLEIYINGLEIY